MSFVDSIKDPFLKVKLFQNTNVTGDNPSGFYRQGRLYVDGGVPSNYLTEKAMHEAYPRHSDPDPNRIVVQTLEFQPNKIPVYHLIRGRIGDPFIARRNLLIPYIGHLERQNYETD